MSRVPCVIGAHDPCLRGIQSDCGQSDWGVCRIVGAADDHCYAEGTFRGTIVSMYRPIGGEQCPSPSAAKKSRITEKSWQMDCPEGLGTLRLDQALVSIAPMEGPIR